MLFTFKYFFKQIIFAQLLTVLFHHIAISADLTESATPLSLDDALALSLQANPIITVAESEKEAIDGIISFTMLTLLILPVLYQLAYKNTAVPKDELGAV